MTFDSGPYVQAACFCDSVIEDKTGVMSLIRVIDTLTRTVSGPNPPAEMPAFTHELRLVLMLKSGSARGRHTLKIIPEMPNGLTKEPILLTAHFEGEERGHNIVVNLSFSFELEGLYWFNVHLDDQKLTAIPFRIKYNRISSGSATS